MPGLVQRLFIGAIQPVGYYMAFGRIEHRARRIGSRSGRQLLQKLKDAVRQRAEEDGGSPSAPVRYHAFAHSLGVQLIGSLLQTNAEEDAAIAAGGQDVIENDTLNTLVLVQGASITPALTMVAFSPMSPPACGASPSSPT